MPKHNLRDAKGKFRKPLHQNFWTKTAVWTYRGLMFIFRKPHAK